MIKIKKTLLGTLLSCLMVRLAMEASFFVVIRESKCSLIYISTSSKRNISLLEPSICVIWKDVLKDRRKSLINIKSFKQCVTTKKGNLLRGFLFL